MENKITTMQEVTPATQKAYDTHARILANGQVMARALVDVCRDLKTMRDEGLYTELGYDTFEEYAEQACGIKQRQAYSYISAYEKLGQKYITDHADLGITKLELIAQINSYEREKFLEEVDAESATVRELKAEVERYKKQTEQLTFDLGQAQREASNTPEPVDTNALRSSIEQEVEAKYSAKMKDLQQRANATPDPETIRKEAKREAANEYKSKLATAKADAEKKAKAAVEKLEQEKADLERQLDSSATKLDAAVRQAKAAGADTDVAACRVYFTELQQTAAKVQELIGKIKVKDPATGTKLSTAVIQVTSILPTTTEGIYNDQLVVSDKEEEFSYPHIAIKSYTVNPKYTPQAFSVAPGRLVLSGKKMSVVQEKGCYLGMAAVSSNSSYRLTSRYRNDCPFYYAYKDDEEWITEPAPGATSDWKNSFAYSFKPPKGVTKIYFNLVRRSGSGMNPSKHSLRRLTNTDAEFTDIADAIKEIQRLAALEFTVDRIDEPKINVAVDYLDLRKDPQYEAFKELEHIELGDTITVALNKLGLSAKARVIKLEYDCLKHELTGCEIGSFKRNYYRRVTQRSYKAMQGVHQLNRDSMTADNTLELIKAYTDTEEEIE